MTAEERAADILRRCWWRSEEHPGEERPIFQGLDLEITDAIRAAVAEEREACAAVCDRFYLEYGESVRTCDTPAGHERMKNRAGGAGECAAAIRGRGA